MIRARTCCSAATLTSSETEYGRRAGQQNFYLKNGGTRERQEVREWATNPSKEKKSKKWNRSCALLVWWGKGGGKGRVPRLSHAVGRTRVAAQLCGRDARLELGDQVADLDRRTDLHGGQFQHLVLAEQHQAATVHFLLAKKRHDDQQNGWQNNFRSSRV